MAAIQRRAAAGQADAVPLACRGPVRALRLLGDGGPAALGAGGSGHRLVDGRIRQLAAWPAGGAGGRGRARHLPLVLRARPRCAPRSSPRAAARARARERLPLVARGSAARRDGCARPARSRSAGEGTRRPGPLRSDAGPLPALATRPAPAEGAAHARGAGRVRAPRARVVRGRLGGLGRHLRQAASDRALRAQPGRRAGQRRGLLAETVVLSRVLLPAASPGHRLAVVALRGRRTVAALATGRAGRSAHAFPSLLGGGAGDRFHASGVEAALLPAAVSPAAGAPRRARPWSGCSTRPACRCA